MTPLTVHLLNATPLRRRRSSMTWFYGNILAVFLAGLIAMGWL